MDRDIRAFLETPDPGVKPVKRRRAYNAFGWTVFLLLLMGGVMASWITSFYVYNHPEDPGCYRLLMKLHRIEPVKRFELTAAPPGKFLTARELYDAYITMPQEEIDAKNSEFLRNYLRNYSQVKTPVPYICGNFTTTGVYELAKSDIFPTGLVAVADSTDCPQVQIEHIYPTEYANIPRARQMLATDPEIKLEKSFSLATIVHVGKLADGRILFTVIPLDYGPYAYRQGISSTFRLDPPPSVNLEAGFPVVKPGAMDNAMKTFALYRKNKGLLAKGKTLTLPSIAPASSQSTNMYVARDIPPEATQPYKPPVPVITPPADESIPENTVADSTAPVTPPSDELPPSTEPSSAIADTTAQAAPEPPPVTRASVSSPVAPVSQTTHTAPVAPVASIPSIVKASPSAPLPQTAPVAASAAPAAPTLSHATTPAKPEKTVAKTSTPALPSSAPAPATLVKPVARVQATPPPAAVIAALPHPAVSKPKVSPTYASTLQVPAKPAAAPTPVPVVQRTEPSYPSPAPVEYAEAVPPQSPATGVKLNPFLAQQQSQPPAQQPQQIQQTQTMAPARVVATWQTYSPGMMPRGKVISMDEAPQLADLGIGHERLYVNGRFIVTASSDGRAVLRPLNYNSGIAGTNVRMVVEYPSGARVPAEGTQVARGALRPFQIVDVRRGDDGQVNIYAREVTVPMNQAAPYAAPYYRNRAAQQSYSSLD